MKIETLSIHAGAEPELNQGAVNTPIFQSSTYQVGEVRTYEDMKYIRLNNTPNHRVLGNRLAALERGQATYLAGSGMAAISATLLTLLRAGDHLLIEKGCYGGTDSFARHSLPAMGIDVTFFDADTPQDTWGVRPETRCVYTESIANPTLRVIDHHKVLAFAAQHRLHTVCDNTFATPVFFRPLTLGYEFVLHSATKYLNGHSDIVAGVVVGPADGIEAVTKTANHLGGCLDPHACFLLERGLKTLALRVRYQSETAQAIAELLERHLPKVHYPGLPSHPHHARARELMPGFGGALAFEFGTAADADRFIGRLQLATKAPSLGGVETLVVRPAGSTNIRQTPDERAAAGISDELVRMAVGCEAREDLLADIDQALG